MFVPRHACAGTICACATEANGDSCVLASTEIFHNRTNNCTTFPAFHSLHLHTTKESPARVAGQAWGKAHIEVNAL
jgi:hypothetical protein